MSITDYYGILGSSVKLGHNVSIKDFCVIEGDVEIGDNTIIEPFTVIRGTRGSIRIGANNHIYSGTCIGYEPQHLAYYKNDKVNTWAKRIVIGDNNIIRENCTIHLPYEKSLTIIGDSNFFMANVHIAHDCTVGNNTVIANNVALGGHCIVDDYANIGLNTCVHQYTHIGEYSMIGMGSVIVKDIMPFHLVYGLRDDVKISINVIGYSRNYKGLIRLRDIKHLRMENYPIYDVNDDLYPELHKLMNKFMENTKNGIYK